MAVVKRGEASVVKPGYPSDLELARVAYNAVKHGKDAVRGSRAWERYVITLDWLLTEEIKHERAMASQSGEEK